MQQIQGRSDKLYVRPWSSGGLDGLIVVRVKCNNDDISSGTLSVRREVDRVVLGKSHLLTTH